MAKLPMHVFVRSVPFQIRGVAGVEGVEGVDIISSKRLSGRIGGQSFFSYGAPAISFRPCSEDRYVRSLAVWHLFVSDQCLCPGPQSSSLMNCSRKAKGTPVLLSMSQQSNFQPASQPASQTIASEPS